MARFCTHCGNPNTNDAAKFCAKCGATFPAQGATTEPAVPPTPAPPPAAAHPVAPAPAPPAAPRAAKSSGPWVKIIVGVLGFFALVSVLAIGTCAYIGYRVKNRVEQAKAEYGLDKLTLPSASSGSSNVQARDVCSLLSKEEVTEITGVAITDAHSSTEKCTYASAANPMVAEVMVTWQGGAMAFKIAAATTKVSAAGEPLIKKLPGIGDEAFTMTPFQGKLKESFQHDLKDDKSGMLKGMSNLLGQFPLVFRKGDVMVSVGVSESPDPDEAKKALAAKIASRL